MAGSTRSQQPIQLDPVRQVLRLHRYSIHPERTYLDWIVRDVRVHCTRSRDDLFPPEPRAVPASVNFWLYRFAKASVGV